MNGTLPSTGARHARSHPAVFRATNTAVLDPDRSPRNGPPLQPRRGRPRTRPHEATLGQPGRIRRPAMPPPLSWLWHGTRRTTVGSHDRLRVPSAWRAARRLRRLCAKGSDPPRACRRTAKIPVPAVFWIGRLARLSPCRLRSGVGHGSRRADCPGDPRPSAGQQGRASFGDGVGANWAGRPCPGAKENLRDARGRDVGHGAEHARRIVDRRFGNCADPASPGYGTIPSCPRPRTSSPCWIASNTHGDWGSIPPGPGVSTPHDLPG